MRLTPAEILLQDLGITEPNEIDLEAIAYHVGAHVRFQQLDGCEARIIGAGEKAIITVNVNSTFRRKRFSIAHELGHWWYHRGKTLACRVEEYRPHDTISPERVADTFAADLLMPNYLFRPIARQQGKLSFKVVTVLADIFKTSQTATAIRLVDGDYAPSVLVCHGQNGRKWFARARSVPEKWFPGDTLDSESFAFGVLFGQKPDDRIAHRIGADAWFGRWDAARYEVHEQSIRTGADEVLTLVLISDQAMLQEREDKRGLGFK